MAEAVPRSNLAAAVALGGVSMNLARSLGPAVGGVVVALAGPAAVFGLNALTFLWVIAALARLRSRKVVTPAPTERWVRAMAAGLRYVRHTKALRAVLFRCAAGVIPGSALMALLPLYARGALGLTSAGFGLLLGSMGVGALLAAPEDHPQRGIVSEGGAKAARCGGGKGGTAQQEMATVGHFRTPPRERFASLSLAIKVLRTPIPRKSTLTIELCPASLPGAFAL